MPARYNAHSFGVGPANPGTGRVTGPIGLPVRLAAAAALLAASAGVLSAPVARAEESAFRSPAQAGAWAMQFRVSDNFQLGSFKGSVLSVKRHSSPSTAIQVGVSGDLSLRSSSEAQEDTNSGYPTHLTDDREEDRYSLFLNAQRLKYTKPAERLSLFWGIGPTVGFSRTDEERTSDIESQSPGEIEQTLVFNSWSAGLGASLGVEWFATRHLGIHAEYGFVAIYRWTDGTWTSLSSDRMTTRTNDSDSFNVRDTGVLVGLSAYF